MSRGWNDSWRTKVVGRGRYLLYQVPMYVDNYVDLGSICYSATIQSIDVCGTRWDTKNTLSTGSKLFQWTGRKAGYIGSVDLH